MSETKKTRVMIGMSGGVDSSAAAALLQEQGFDLVGVTLKLWPQDCVNRAEDKCCGPEAVKDARAVAHQLGIPYYLVDESAEFQKQVIAYFAEEYKAGRTPNPCVMCNERLKFGTLLHRADQLGAQLIATGHFARTEKCPTTGRTLLKRGRDPRKDQSYFLFSLKQWQLERTIFPLGAMTKSDTRDLARECKLKTAEKEESMEICFVPDNDYGKFLEQAKLAARHRGDIVDVHGRKLGEHDGIEFYTIGQRKGLGLSAPKPLYVVELDAANNRVIVGDETMLDRAEFRVERCNWIPFEKPTAAAVAALCERRSEEPQQEGTQPREDRRSQTAATVGPSIEVTAKIRYNHPGTPATVTPTADGGALVKLHEAQRAITPGQACVFYQDDLVVGGGWIAR